MTKSADIYYPKDEIEKALILNIWRLTEHGLGNRKEIILPKGTVEIIFNFSDDVTYFNPSLNISRVLPSAFVNGLNFVPFQLLKSGSQSFLGIQLKSFGLKILFNSSIREFNNCVFSGDELGFGLNALADDLYHHDHSFDLQVGIILSWIKKRLSGINCIYSIKRAQKLTLLVNNHNITVRKLSDGICLSDRQLRRFCADWLGMNTEEFIQYNKYLNSLHRLHYSKQKLCDLAFEMSYYDQSHFIREFKTFTGLTPKQYRLANAVYPGHIQT